MTKVMITFVVPEEYVDPDHETGMTEEGHDALADATNDLGWEIHSGPDRVGS